MQPAAMGGTGSGSTVVPVLDERGPGEGPAPQELGHVHGLRRVRLPAWTKTVMALATAVALLGVSACGQSTPREPGCVTPSNEDALLDDYAADPILTFVPDGGHRTQPIKQVHGCLVGNPPGDVSQTSALTIFDLSRDYDQAGVRAAFAAVTTEHDWAPDQLRQAAVDQIRRTEGPDMQTPYLTYCRQVHGVTTEANITVVAVGGGPGPDGRVKNGQMEVWIAADPQRANCQAQVSDPHYTGGLWDWN